METIKFEKGYRTTYSGLYGGSYTVEVVKRTKSTVTFREYWIAEDTGKECHSDRKFDIEVEHLTDDISIERIVVWEYRSECGYLYAADWDTIDYVSKNGKIPSEDEEYFDEWEEDWSLARPSCTTGDYSPSCPWNAPGMSVHDFI